MSFLLYVACLAAQEPRPPDWEVAIPDAAAVEEVFVVGDYLLLRCRDASNLEFWASVRSEDHAVAAARMVAGSGGCLPLGEEHVAMREGDTARVLRLADGAESANVAAPSGGAMWVGSTALYVAMGNTLRAVGPDGADLWSVALPRCDGISAVAETERFVLAADVNSDARVTRNLVTIAGGRVRRSTALGFTGAVVRSSFESGTPIEIRRMTAVGEFVAATRSDGPIAFFDPSRGPTGEAPYGVEADGSETWRAHLWGREAWLIVSGHEPGGGSETIHSVYSVRPGALLATLHGDFPEFHGPWMVAERGGPTTRAVTDLRRNQPTCTVPEEAVVNEANAAVMREGRIGLVDLATGRDAGTLEVALDAAPGTEARLRAAADLYLLSAGNEGIVLRGADVALRLRAPGEIVGAFRLPGDFAVATAGGGLAGWTFRR